MALLYVSVFQVVRYTALVSGIFYGIVHLRTLRKEHAHELEAHKAHQREKWVEQAKAEFKKKQEQGKSGLKGLLEAGKEAVGQAGSGECEARVQREGREGCILGSHAGVR